jgi:O-antigen ligase
MTALAAKIFHITRWGATILFVGVVTGAMAVLFPPMAAIGFVALIATILLWALPELRFVPEKLLRNMFFMMVFVQLCIPNYYAIETGYLPWISVRKVFSLVVIILFGITVAGSKSARNKIAETLRFNRLLAFCAFGFLAAMFLSLLTSENFSNSIKLFSDAVLNMYVPLLACILIVRSEEDIILLLKIIAIAAIIDSAAGALEFFLQRRYYFDLIPKGMLDSMLANNPTLNAMYYGAAFRNGQYRANSIYSVSLSFAEFAAMTAPIAFYFVFHGRDRKERILGIITGASILIALFCSGARGGYSAFLVAMPIMTFLWVLRYSKLNPQSLVSSIMGVIFAMGITFSFGAVAFWPRVHDMVLGNEWEGAESTEARFEQWNLAVPHIIANPVTGHGLGNSGTVIGYHIESGLPSVDSYIITLLVETGIPGLIFFFGMIAIGIWISFRLYLMDNQQRTAIGGPIGCCLIAFGFYRVALSQTENHTLLFIIIGIVFGLSKLCSGIRNNRRGAFAVSGPRPF